MMSLQFDLVQPQFDFKNFEPLPFTVQGTIRVSKP